MPANNGRRAESSAQPAQETTKVDLQDFHRECGGMFKLSIFNMRAAALCAAAAILGDGYVKAVVGDSLPDCGGKSFASPTTTCASCRCTTT